MRNDARTAGILVLALLWSWPASARTGRPSFWLGSEDGGSWIGFHLALQFRWEYLYEDTGEGRATRNDILFRRIRPVIEGSLLSEDLTYRLHLNLVPGSLELMDLWFDYRFIPQLRVMAGQMKIPYTRYRLNSYMDRPVVEWSQPTRYLGGERQIGFMLHNGVGRPPALEYQLGLFTGVNARASCAMGMPIGYAEDVGSPSSLTDPAGMDDLHSEIVGHLAYNYGGIDVRIPSDLEGGPPRFSVGLSGAWDLHPTPRRDLRLRIAPEASLKAYGFSLDLVFHLGWFDRAAGSGEHLLGMTGGVAQASWVFLEKYEIALRYTFVHLLADLRDDARAWAVSRIEVDGDVYERYREVGRLQTEHEANLGFNVYFFGPAVKWQVDLGLLVHDRTDDVRYDLQLRTQMQLAF